VTNPPGKAALRRRLRDTRRAIADRDARSAEICSSVATLPAFTAASVVMSFASFASEVDTSSLHTRVWDDGKALLLPRVEGHDLVAVPVEAGEPLVPSPFGMGEPSGVAVDVARLDRAVVVVPGLAFTPDGHRLGYGQGHYDRFLSRLPATAVTVGICFREQLVDDLPLDAHDLPVGMVVTG
jgi:5-formyltetrahydrofolate cyclo-ligase